MVLGAAYPPTAPSRLEIAVAERLAPRETGRAARWAVASMELGRVVCVARTPRCADCPVRDLCAWRRAGAPAWSGPPRRGQAYAGTDRQCRGALLAVLRSADEPVAAPSWPPPGRPAQRERALASLVADGLVVAASRPLVPPRLIRNRTQTAERGPVKCVVTGS